MIWHWLLTVTGINNTSGTWYGFWSGFASDLTEFGVILVIYKRFKCKNCWRLAHHKVEGTHYKTCHKHLTKSDHDNLRMKHEYDYPEQHKILEGSA